VANGENKQTMITLISPAKIQNFKPQNVTDKFSQPQFIKEAQQLVELTRELSPLELSNLLSINAQLTQLNFNRFFNWHLPFTPESAKQTVLAYDGEVFRGLNAKEFTTDDFDYAQSHLRILSGLYGVLRPLDLIQPYRLEVSSKLKNKFGDDLYAFWKTKVTNSILKDLKESGQPETIVNLASSEYFKTLDIKKRKFRFIDVEFYEFKEDNYKQIVIYIKKARGMMARYIIKNRIENEEDLKGFAGEGYWFNPQMSTENKFVFIR